MQGVFKFVILGLAILSTCTSVPTAPRNIAGRLEFDDGVFVVLWEIDEARTQLTLDVTVECQGWFGIGFSKSGNMFGADIAVAQMGTNEQGEEVLEVKDYFSTSNNFPVLDTIQNLRDVSAGRNDTHSYAHFTRSLNTGDDTQDNIINLDGIFIMWAYALRVEQMEYHRNTRGSELVTFESSK